MVVTVAIVTVSSITPKAFTMESPLSTNLDMGATNTVPRVTTIMAIRAKVTGTITTLVNTILGTVTAMVWVYAWVAVYMAITATASTTTIAMVSVYTWVAGYMAVTVTASAATTAIRTVSITLSLLKYALTRIMAIHTTADTTVVETASAPELLTGKSCFPYAPRQRS